MSAVKIQPYYTYKDYCAWEGRWELIDGIPFAMSPGSGATASVAITKYRLRIKIGFKKIKMQTL
ncbi:MAG TPA: hypothetical protein VJ279_02270 [Hanamia sp.]|nr:hypothetical protein [Hanamia sp.]